MSGTPDVTGLDHFGWSRQGASYARQYGVKATPAARSPNEKRKKKKKEEEEEKEE